jgi:hypothetical protein
MMRTGRLTFPWFRVVLRLLLVVGLLFVILRVINFGFVHFFVHSIDEALLRQQAHLLYDIDHVALAREARSFAQEQRMQSKIPRALRQGDPEIPSSLAVLNAKSVYITEDLIQLDFGGVLPFGIVVYNEGLEGPGAKKLGEGIWFYSDNGAYPSPKGDKLWGPRAY